MGCPTLRIRIKRDRLAIIFLYRPESLCQTRRMTFGPGRGSDTRTGFCAELPADTIRSGRLRDVYAYRSEEHTSELQSLMRISYAVFCLTNETISDTITELTTYQ